MKRNKTHTVCMLALSYGSGFRRLARRYGWRAVKVAYKEVHRMVMVVRGTARSQGKTRAFAERYGA